MASKNKSLIVLTLY